LTLFLLWYIIIDVGGVRLNIELEKDLYLVNDGTQLILRKYGYKKKDKYKVVGYYGNLEEAIQGYLRHKVVTSEAKSINRLLNEIRALRNHITLLFEREV